MNCRHDAMRHSSLHADDAHRYLLFGMLDEGGDGVRTAQELIAYAGLQGPMVTFPPKLARYYNSRIGTILRGGCHYPHDFSRTDNSMSITATCIRRSPGRRSSRPSRRATTHHAMRVVWMLGCEKHILVLFCSQNLSAEV